MNYESRVLFGFFDEQRDFTVDDQSTISRGFIKIVLESTSSGFSKINEVQDFDEPPRIYYKDKIFSKLQQKTQRRLVKIENPIQNDSYIEGGSHSKFVVFDKNITELSSHTIYSIIDFPLPDPMNTSVRLPIAPKTKYFFLKENDDVYGPFILEPEANNKDSGDEILLSIGEIEVASDKIHNFPDLIASRILKYSYSNLKVELNKSLIECDDCSYITDIKSFLKINKEQTDYTTKRDIKRYLSQLADKRLLNKANVAVITTSLNAPKIHFNTAGKELIKSLVLEATEKDEVAKYIIDVVSNDESGKVLIAKHLELMKSKYIDEWDTLAKKKHKEISEKISDIENKEKQLHLKIKLAESELEHKKTELDKIIKELKEEDYEDRLNQLRKEKDQEIQSKLVLLEEISSKYKKYNSLDEIEKAAANAENTYNVFKDRNRELQATFDSLKMQIENKEGELQTTLRRLIPYVSSIIQAPIPNRQEFAPFQTISRVNPVIEIKDDAEKTASIIVNAIAFQFSEFHERSYSNAFIASILVAFSQSFITIFTGPPGQGKTSFLRILNKILNLENRFIEVPVGRNWVSERDLFGFYNSLTGSFSPSSTGLYNYLRGIEKDDFEECPPQLLLLDEANLSPIEHYGASLLNKADKESDRKINIPFSDISIPSTLRVFATVNHDMTTEPLSPRLLDRAPVVPFDVFTDMEIDYQPIEYSPNYGFKTFDSIFGVSSKLKSNDIEDICVKVSGEIFEILSNTEVQYGVPFIISKRKQQSILNYILVLAPVLDVVTKLGQKDAMLKAIDFAVLYFVLPPLNGSGTQMLERLQKLLEKLNEHSLTMSSDKISDMISRGNHNLESYNFFHY